MPTREYPEAASPLEPGSTLVLYTDGLVEERGASIDAGLDALKKARPTGRPTPTRCATTWSTGCSPTAPPTDDIAVLAVRTVPMSTERLHLRPADEPEGAGHAAPHARALAGDAGASRMESNDIQVSCHEACSNAMEHGYRFREATIEVDGEFDGEEVLLTVADRGAWREKRDSDRGRGLDLISALMDAVEVEPERERHHGADAQAACDRGTGRAGRHGRGRVDAALAPQAGCGTIRM